MLNKVFGKRNQQELSPTCNGTEDSAGFQEHPRICLVDIEANAEEALMSAGFNCVAGSLGSSIRLPNEKIGDRCTCRLEYGLPSNLHEYDIIIIDLKNREPTHYDSSRHEPPGGKQANQEFLVCEYPQTIFDPRPLSAAILRSTINEIQKKESIIVVFAAKRDDTTYQPVELTTRGYSRLDSFELDNYSFLSSAPATDNKKGMETKVVAEDTELNNILQRYNQEFVYDIVFHKFQHEKDSRLRWPLSIIPLVENLVGEIVSYARLDEDSIVFVFPQLEDKTSFLIELFQRYLPAIAPNLFPFSTQFAWITDNKYHLPNETELLAEKRAIEQEYTEQLTAKKREIEENRQKFQFLHDLLIETDKRLVKAVEQYLHWLGFDDIVNCDEARPGRKEEDLQVSIEGGLLVVEVKGIGGTSRDSECSQISKIKYRRAKERSSFDVFALYIVNHQRYLPPETRSNPPFTGQQIEDAGSDERGLLTTYDLFKLYFAIESGFITKEDARKSFLDYGLVTFKPSNSLAIGKPLEIHYNGTVGIFFLQDVAIRLTENLLVYENGRCREVQVVSLRNQDEDVTEASEGEIGIGLSDSITKESELWKPEFVHE